MAIQVFDPLLTWVNCDHPMTSDRKKDQWTEESRARVVECLELAQEAYNEHYADEKIFRQWARGTHSDAERMAEYKRLETSGHFDRQQAIHKRLQKSLERYEGTWQVALVSRFDDSDDAATFILDQHMRGNLPQGEYSAIRELIRKVNSRLLHKVKRCSCGFWYKANRIDQKSCSSLCRHKLYEQTPAAKRKRKAYLREYNLSRKHRPLK